MSSFAIVMSHLALSEHNHSTFWLYAILRLGDSLSTGSDVESNACREVYRRLRAANVGEYTLAKVRAALNTLENSIDAGTA